MSINKYIRRVIMCAALSMALCGCRGKDAPEATEAPTAKAPFIDLNGDGIPDEVVTVPRTEPDTEEVTTTAVVVETAAPEPSQSEPDTPAPGPDENVEETPSAEPDEEVEETPAVAVAERLEVEIPGEFYIGDTLTAENFNVKLFMSDGSVIESPPGWAAYPLRLDYENNLITILYEELSTQVQVPATERPKQEIVRSIAGNGAIFYDNHSDITVCVDPGHQGAGNNGKEPNGPGSEEMKTMVATGTTGVATGIRESVMVLNASMKIRDELLAHGYNVLMVRESQDVDIPNSTRALMGNTANICIHIHGNGVNDQSVSGLLCMVPSTPNPWVGPLAPECARLAELIRDYACMTSGAKKMSNLVTDKMTTLNWSTVPAVIIELGFMTNPDEDRLLNNDDYQALLARGIVAGIDAYFGR